MAICGICGAEYEERGYQVVVPELRASFDTIECAEIARRRRRRERCIPPDLTGALAAEIARLRHELNLRLVSKEVEGFSRRRLAALSRESLSVGWCLLVRLDQDGALVGSDTFLRHDAIA